MESQKKSLSVIREKFLKKQKSSIYPSKSGESVLPPSIMDDHTEENIKQEIKILRSSPQFDVFNHFLKDYCEDCWVNSHWRELCLSSDSVQNNLASDKLYLAIIDGRIKYRTNHTEGDSFVELGGDISKQDGELYQAIEKNNLVELSEPCRKKVLYIAAKRGDIDVSNFREMKDSSDVVEYEEKEEQARYAAEFQSLKKIISTLETVIKKEKFDYLLGEVSRQLELDEFELSLFINRKFFITDTAEERPFVKSIESIKDKTPFYNILEENKVKTADGFFREKILEELVGRFGFDDFDLFKESFRHYYASNKSESIIEALEKCKIWSDIDHRLAKSISDLTLNFNSEKINNLSYLVKKENNKKSNDFLLESVISELKGIFRLDDIALFQETIVLYYETDSNTGIVNQLMKCKDWGDIDADLAESILHLVLNCKTDVNCKKISRFCEALSEKKNNQALRAKIIEELQEIFGSNHFGLFKEYLLNYYANDESETLINEFILCNDWASISVDLAKNILSLMLNFNSERICRYTQVNQGAEPLNFSLTNNEDIRLTCINELRENFGIDNIELFKDIVLNWHINDKNIEINNVTALRNCKKWSDISYSLAEYLLGVARIGSEKLAHQDFEKKHGGKYKKITEAYERTYQFYNKIDIALYAKELRKKESSKQYDEISAIAVMMRASQISVGYGFRKIQILAILEFLDKGTNKFCQINTGEGKTTITAALAVLKVLQGEQVDIITSNPVLAEDAIKEKSDFYALFGISVSHNNPNPDAPYIQGKKICYNNDVVYGTLGVFALDYLNNDVELLETKTLRIKHFVPVERQYATVIVDEADNVVLDNYALITNQAKSIAGLDHVKFLYFNIWQELITQEAILGFNEQDITDECKAILNDSMDREKLATSIKKDSQIPNFIKKVLIKKINVLIENAIKARYDLHLDEDYIISNVEDEDNILPLEKDIGVRLRNFTWTDLHPFVQIKHNLNVNSSASISSVFIPNFAYLAKYNTIYGLTGTLGCQQEQDLIYKIYKASSTIIPPFRTITKQKIHPVQADNESDWLNQIEQVAREYTKRRAVLFVCDTPKSLKKVHMKLQQAGLNDITIYEHDGDVSKIDKINDGTRYELCLMSDISGNEPEPGKIYLTVEEKSVKYRTNLTPGNRFVELVGNISQEGGELYQAIERKKLEQISPSCKETLLHLLSTKKHTLGKGLAKGQIIISTNIGGRGTDIKLNSELKKNGGLHEVTTYLPKNQRTEMQASGRAGRSGDPGSSQIIYQASEVDVLIKIVQRKKAEDLFSLEGVDPFSVRDEAEALRLKDAEDQLRHIIHRYTWAIKFQSIYAELKRKETVDYFILEDIKLTFGLLYQQELEEELSVFLSELSQYASADSDKTKHKFINPYYAISYAQSLLRKGDYTLARKVLNINTGKTEKGFDFFYDAITDQLNVLNIDSDNVKKRAIDYLRADEKIPLAEQLKKKLELRDPFLCQNIPDEVLSIQDYLKYHETDEAAIDGGMMVSLAHSLDITIKILNEDADNIFYINRGCDSGRTANLKYDQGRYYSVILPLERELEDLLFYKELVSIAGYHLSMFQIEIYDYVNVLSQLLPERLVKTFSSYLEKSSSEKNRPIDCLNRAKEILQRNLDVITQFITSPLFENICLPKQIQAYNLGHNMMQKHLESEQLLIIITLSHVDSLLQLFKNDDKVLYLKSVITFEEVVQNGLDVGLPIEELLATERSLSSSLGLGIYYEVNTLITLNYSDADISEACAKILQGSTLLLLNFIPALGVFSKLTVGAGLKYIVIGVKKLLSVMMNDPYINDENEHFLSFFSSIVLSSPNPTVAIVKTLTTVITQVMQNFLAKLWISHGEKNNVFLNQIKNIFFKPLRDLIYKPMEQISNYRRDIFQSIKEYLLSPLKKLKESLLIYWRDNYALLAIGNADGSKAGIENWTENLSLIINDINSLKNILLNIWQNSVSIFNKIKKLPSLIEHFKKIKLMLIKKDVIALIEGVTGFIKGDLWREMNGIITEIDQLFNPKSEGILSVLTLLMNIHGRSKEIFEKFLLPSISDASSMAVFFFSLLPSVGNLIDYVQEIFDKFVLKIEDILTTILENNPIDSFLKKYGIDFANLDHTVDKIISYSLALVVKFIKSLIFRSKIEEGNKNNVDEDSRLGFSAGIKKENQCVKFALLKLLDFDEKQLFSVTRSYLSGKMTEDEGLTKWQTKFILEDLGFKVAETKTDKKEQYHAIAYDFLRKNNSECGGLSLVTGGHKSGHAFYITMQGENSVFIDERSSGASVNDLEIYNKSYFLVPMNFTCQKRIEIKNNIEKYRHKSIWLNFKFIIRYILEHFFENEKFGARADDVSKLALYVCERIFDPNMGIDTDKARSMGVLDSEINFVKNEILGKLDVGKEDFFRKAWTSRPREGLDEAFATSIMRDIYLELSRQKQEKLENVFAHDNVVGFFALASHFRLPTEMTGFNLVSEDDSFVHVDLPKQNPIFQHPTSKDALYVYFKNPSHHLLDKKRVTVSLNAALASTSSNICLIVFAAAKYTVNYMVAPPLAKNNKTLLISDSELNELKQSKELNQEKLEKLKNFNKKREEFKKKLNDLGDYLGMTRSDSQGNQPLDAEWLTPKDSFDLKGRCSSPPRTLFFSQANNVEKGMPEKKKFKTMA